MKILQQLSRLNMVEEFDYSASNNISFCESCLKGKQQGSQSSLHSERKRYKPLELIHSDVCGKISSKQLGGAEYFVTFIDDKLSTDNGGEFTSDEFENYLNLSAIFTIDSI